MSVRQNLSVVNALSGVRSSPLNSQKGWLSLLLYFERGEACNGNDGHSMGSTSFSLRSSSFFNWPVSWPFLPGWFSGKGVKPMMKMMSVLGCSTSSGVKILAIKLASELDFSGCWWWWCGEANDEIDVFSRR